MKQQEKFANFIEVVRDLHEQVMRFALILLSLLVAGISLPVSAMSLGEGQVQSHIGEPFSANIAIVGSYRKDVRFNQVRGAECNSSIIANTENGCGLLYEGNLTLTVKQRHDGQYYLQVTAEDDNEMFYRIILKSVSATGETVFKLFEFLPEFKTSQDVQQAESGDMDVTLDNVPSGSHGVVMGEIIEMPTDHEKSEPASAKKSIVQVESMLPKAETDETIKPGIDRKQGAMIDAPGEKPEVKPVPKLRITENYAEGIDELLRDHEKIEKEIVLLEKQLGLLKEVIKLRAQVGASSTAVGVPVNATAPVDATLPPPSARAGNDAGMLNRILLVAVLVLLSLLLIAYRRLKKSNGSTANPASTHISHDDRESLDLTDAVAKPI